MFVASTDPQPQYSCLKQHRCVDDDDDEPRLKPFKRSSEPWLEDMNSSFRMSSVVSVPGCWSCGCAALNVLVDAQLVQ
jgi:hypothetical protein